MKIIIVIFALFQLTNLSYSKKNPEISGVASFEGKNLKLNFIVTNNNNRSIYIIGTTWIFGGNISQNSTIIAYGDKVSLSNTFFFKPVEQRNFDYLTEMKNINILKIFPRIIRIKPFSKIRIIILFDSFQNYINNKITYHLYCTIPFTYYSDWISLMSNFKSNIESQIMNDSTKYTLTFKCKNSENCFMTDSERFDIYNDNRIEINRNDCYLLDKKFSNYLKCKLKIGFSD
jgi:hypothetical protein